MNQVSVWIANDEIVQSPGLLFQSLMHRDRGCFELQVQRFDVFDKNAGRQQIALRLFGEHGPEDEAQVETSPVSFDESVIGRLSILETHGEAYCLDEEST